MKLNTLVTFVLWAMLTSCNGQSTSQGNNSKENAAQIAIGDTVSQLGNNIMVVFQDSKNVYWFGSWETGLYQFDGKTLINFTTKHGLPHNHVGEIKEDRFGNIFINTNAGLCKYDGKQLVSIPENMLLVSDWKLQPDDLWFKNPNSGHVYRYDGRALVSLKLPKTKIGEEYLAKHPNALDPYAVYCIYTDSQKNVWFGTASLGAMRYNGKSFDWISESDVTELHDGPANGVRSVVEDQEGFFWFNSAFRYKMLPKVTVGTEGFYERHKSIGTLDGKQDGDFNEYLSIAKDNANHLWIATYRRGVWQYDGRKVKHYPVRENGLDIKLFYVYKDNDGSLWLGTHENGAWKWNGEAFERFKR